MSVCKWDCVCNNNTSGPVESKEKKIFTNGITAVFGLSLSKMQRAFMLNKYKVIMYYIRISI